MPDNAWVAKILRLVKARVKPNANVLLKELSKIKLLNKILLHPWFNDLLSHHQRICILGSSSENLPLAEGSSAEPTAG